MQFDRDAKLDREKFSGNGGLRSEKRAREDELKLIWREITRRRLMHIAERLSSTD